ncbi:SET domain-containing protein [Tothia fuscella]|uniref:SET domain-containing protein n=1 Tax=Tothia fuscella TaxID=1048955 RepID=A0A9P4TS34_9PEZI|nr:SET domain-containing protein [Tothia fuscella]
MGIDAGFDMDPPLSKSAIDRHDWEQFIAAVKARYKDDDQFEIKSNYINFRAGEHPKLPFEGHKFLRFSSKISGSNARTSGVEQIIVTVGRIARSHFGSRVKYWNEAANEYGVYGWEKVDESIISYIQPDELETPITAESRSDSNPVLFEIKDIPGKGRGMVACCDISKGKRILCEGPLLTATPMFSQAELEVSLGTKLKGMPKPLQRQFLSLHNNFPGKFPFSGIVKTNALPCGSGSKIAGVYATACLINHSCVPNAHNSWNDLEGHETIHATRNVNNGEEITITYEHGRLSSDRQSFFRETFGFTCTCSTCSLPPSLLRASDKRRAHMERLDKAIGDPARMVNSLGKSLRDCYVLLQILDKEFDSCPGALSARVYYDAFQICIVHGDQARARIFAERAHKKRVICEGDDSPSSQRMKLFALIPSAHNKWRTTKDSAPINLETTTLDVWLFRLKE